MARKTGKTTEAQPPDFGIRLNHRQKALLHALLRDAEGSLSIGVYGREFGISYNTARNDLLALTRAMLLVTVKAGANTLFVPAPDLRDRVLERSDSRVFMLN
jgi:Fic family protein